MQVVEAGARVCLVVGEARSNATLVFCWDAARETFTQPRVLATGCSAKVRLGRKGEDKEYDSKM